MGREKIIFLVWWCVCSAGVLLINFFWPRVVCDENVGHLYLLGLIIFGANYFGCWLMGMLKRRAGYIFYGVGLLTTNISVMFFWLKWNGRMFFRWDIVLTLAIVVGLINFIMYLLFRFEDNKNGKVVDSRCQINKN